jgi:hypothetical protein
VLELLVQEEAVEVQMVYVVAALVLVAVEEAAVVAYIVMTRLLLKIAKHLV